MKAARRRAPVVFLGDSSGPRSAGVVVNRRGRPWEWSRTLDAAALFAVLRRNGRTWRTALDDVEAITGVNRREIEKYAAGPVKPLDDQSEDTIARFAVHKRGWGKVARALGIALPAVLTEPTDRFNPGQT